MKDMIKLLVVACYFAPLVVVAGEDSLVEHKYSVYTNGGEFGGRIALNCGYTLSAGLSAYFSRSLRTDSYSGEESESKSHSIYPVLGLRRLKFIDEKFRYYLEAEFLPSYSVSVGWNNSRNLGVKLAGNVGAEYFLFSQLSIEGKMGVSCGYTKTMYQDGNRGEANRCGTQINSLMVNWYF